MTFNLLSIVVGVFYIAMGVFVINYKFFVVSLEDNIAYPFGALLMVYGIFRIARVIYRLRKKDEA